MSNRARILVIDDDPLLRSVIVSLLRKNYDVDVASEGSEGYYQALENPPDAIVLDIQMPGWDGLQSLKAIRNHPLLQHVKIMMLTSDASKETVLAAIHGGADDYVIKTSFSKEEFVEKLGCLLPVNPVDDALSAILPTDPEIDKTPSTSVALAGNVKSSPADTSRPVSEDDSAQEIIDSWE